MAWNGFGIGRLMCFAEIVFRGVKIPGIFVRFPRPRCLIKERQDPFFTDVAWNLSVLREAAPGSQNVRCIHGKMIV